MGSVNTCWYALVPDTVNAGSRKAREHKRRDHCPRARARNRIIGRNAAGASTVANRKYPIFHRALNVRAASPLLDNEDIRRIRSKIAREYARARCKLNHIGCSLARARARQPARSCYRAERQVQRVPLSARRSRSLLRSPRDFDRSIARSPFVRIGRRSEKRSLPTGAAPTLTDGNRV